MIVNDRYGSLVVDNTADVATVAGSFALFGRRQVSLAEAIADGVDLFAARVSAFDNAMQSCYEHILLKQDLVEHIVNNFTSN